jgi:hypothetical protein
MYLYDKSESRWLWWSFFCSVLVHVLMLAVMATTSIFFPMAGDNTRLDIVWIYPQFLFGGETGNPLPLQSSPTEEKGTPPETGNNEKIPQKPFVRVREQIKTTSKAGNPVRVPPPAPLPVLEKAAKPSPAIPEPLSPVQEQEQAQELDQDQDQEMKIPAETFPVQPAEAGTEHHAKVIAKESPHPVDKDLPAGKPIETISKASIDKTVTPNVDRTASAPAAKLPPAADPPILSRSVPLSVEKPQAPVRQTVAKNAPAPQLPPAAPRKDTATVPATPPQPLPHLGVTGREQKNTADISIKPSSPSKSIAADPPAGKTPMQSTGPKGIFAPPLIGDLKIEITGPDEALKSVRISALFREYPKARHNRPMSKASAGNVRVLTPKMARVAKNILQAVIVFAEEGIYDFRSLSNSDGLAAADFSVKIYENSGRAKTKSAGTRKVGDKGSIAKVLMPEGILWNDESAFSGSMEDSESVTRFNSDTGLVWKEFKE